LVFGAGQMPVKASEQSIRLCLAIRDQAAVLTPAVPAKGVIPYKAAVKAKD
tara:strand:+ start:251 stop:403 length:153 start_codon:yes stop_codon:yes gene_type:complete